MPFYSDLREYLSLQPEVTALTERIRVGMADQEDVLPYLVIVPEGETRRYASSGSVGLVTRTLTINAVATTLEAVDELKEAVRIVLDTYQGAMQLSEVRSCFLSQVTFDEVPPRQSQGRGDVAARMAFQMLTTEARPRVRS